MPTNIAAIQARRLNFRTQANADWLDGLPLIARAGLGGVVAGAENTGNGGLSVAGVAPGTAYGAHIVSITSIDGLPRFTVQAPNGGVTANGVVGAPLFAGGITFTIAAGAHAFAVDDTFAISVMPVALDISGIRFDLQARLSKTDANVRLSASSAPDDPDSPPTIAVGGPGGLLAMRVLRDAMSREAFPPATYVYDLLASADGVRVPVFYGAITHVDGVTFLP